MGPTVSIESDRLCRGSWPLRSRTMLSASAWRRLPRHAAVALLLLLLLSLGAELVESYCVKMEENELPAADFNDCGQSTFVLWGVYSTLYIDAKCSNPACMRLFAFVDAANPTECTIKYDNMLQLRSGVLTPLYDACAKLANPPSPTVAPAPPAPVPSTKTPKPATTSRSPPVTTTTPPSEPPSVTSSDVTTPTSSPEADESPPAVTATTSPSTKTPAPAAGSESPQTTVGPANNHPGGSSATSEAIDSQTTTPSMARSPPPPAENAPGLQSSSDSSAHSALWIIIAVVVASVVGIIFFFVVKRKRRQHEDIKSPEGSTNATGESSTAYLSSHEILASSGHLLPASYRQQMDELLRDDATLESWRLVAKSITDKKFLGKGSHAFVHLVELHDGTLLASKRLASDQATPQNLAQLIGEVHIVATLQHPSVVRFAGVAWTSALDFQVLFEYMRGGDLRSFLDRQPTPDGSAWSPNKLKLALGIAEGLAYAHSFNAPLVHRDLKSRNVLLTDDTQARISDFGVSRFQSEQSTMTTGIGTTRWQAPEVITGGGTYDETCDIYSFGVVLTELETNAVPLAREMAQVDENGRQRSELWLLREVARGTLRPSLTPSCPSEVAQLTSACLAFHPSERPNALEIAYALRKLASRHGGLEMI